MLGMGEKPRNMYNTKNKEKLLGGYLLEYQVESVYIEEESSITM